MRINRDTLLKIANDSVSRHTRRGHDVVSAYLCGSLLGNDYALGGTVDIDLIFIHIDTPVRSREISRLTDEVHLDIGHYEQRQFRQTRELRLSPWLGPTIFNAQILYDPSHFMDFTQASVRGQFHRAEYVIARARQGVEAARATWLGFYRDTPEEPGPEQIGQYLAAVEAATNSVALLNGPALPERRLLLEFPDRARAVGREGMYHGLLGMLGAPNVNAETLRGWLADWEMAFLALPEETAPVRLQPARQAYYYKAFEAMLEGGEPMAVLYPLLNTWTQAAGLLGPDHAARSAWREAFSTLAMLGQDFNSRVEALDAYLDTVEETLDAWAQANGID